MATHSESMAAKVPVKVFKEFFRKILPQPQADHRSPGQTRVPQFNIELIDSFVKDRFLFRWDMAFPEGQVDGRQTIDTWIEKQMVRRIFGNPSSVPNLISVGCWQVNDESMELFMRHTGMVKLEGAEGLLILC